MKLQMRKVLSLVLALTLVLGLAPVRAAAEGTSPRYISLAQCPSFTLRGPEGVYPLEQYSNNAMVLVFGRITCGNTQALLSQLNGMVDSLAEQGIQVFANMEYTFLPEDFSAIRSAYPNITYTYGDDMIRTRLLDLVDPHLDGFVFPVVFVIDRNGSIIYYSTGYVSDMEPLLTKAEAAATNQPLPDPQPWDDRFYGSLYNYTGDDAALEDYIHQELLEKNPYISAYDSVWTGSMDIWQGEDLAYAMFDVLEGDVEEYGPYTVPDTWVYYTDARQVLIILDYPYVPTVPTDPVETEPAPNVTGGTCGENLTWTLDGEGTLTISGTGNMENYETEAEIPWAEQREEIKRVVLEEGVTRIGAYAFVSCTNLTGVTISGSVRRIGSNAFLSCGLTEVTIPEGVTQIDDAAFENCGHLTDIILSASVTQIGPSAFYGCSSLTTVHYGGTEEEKADISIISENKPILEAQWHYRCDGVTCESTEPEETKPEETKPEETKPEEATEATDPENIEGTESTDPIDPDATDPGNVTWDLSDGVLTVSGTGAMEDHSMPWSDLREEIRSVVIEEGITYVGAYAFYECPNLTQVTLPLSVTAMGDQAFSDCPVETSYYAGAPSQWEEITQNNSGPWNSVVYCEKAGRDLTWDFADGVLTVSGAGEMDGFSNMMIAPWEGLKSRIETVVIREGVTSVNPAAFHDCTALTAVTIPKTVIELNVFGGENSLQAITVDQDNPAYTSEDGILFNKDKTVLIQYPCQKADTRYSIPEGVTEIGNYAFANSDNLTRVTFPESLRILGHFAFMECDGLRHVIIPGHVTELGYSSFQSCTGLESVEVESGITDLPMFMFEGCASLEEVTLPDTLINIWENTFAYCTSLKRLKLPAGMNFISDGAFHDSTALEEIIIGGVREIYWPIGGCTALKKVVFQGDAPGHCEQAFYEATLTAYYPAGNATWTDAVRESFGGNVTWIAMAYSGTCGDDLTWSFDNGTLTISGTGDMYDYSGDQTNPAPWAQFGDDMEILVVEEGVTGIGDNAFDGCAIMEGHFPGTLVSVGDSAGLRGLAYINQTVRRWSKIDFGENNTGFPWWDAVRFVVEDPIVKSGKAGEHIYWELDKDGILVFFGNGEMYDFGATASPFAESSVKTATIGEGITNIGANLFETWGSSALGKTLESVTVASSVTRVETMAFTDCKALKTVTFTGDAPSFGENCFRGVTATAYYPADNATWTAAVMQDYEGDITWLPYTHEHTFGEWITEDNLSTRTCTLCGYMEQKVTTDSGDVELELPDQPGLNADVVPVRPSDSDYVLVEEALNSAEEPNQKILKVFDINLKNSDGVHVQPDGAVKVKLPLDWEKEGNYKVYRVNDDGTLTDMNAYRQGSHMVFETDHFSLYVMVEVYEDNPFEDVALDQWYAAPVLWAVNQGITNGMTETTFAPDGTCTRAQIVTFLWRANGSPAPASANNPFTDVPAGQWYTDAVLWAVEKGITTGTSATTFSPDAGCTRGQVATFLWRANGQPAAGGENIFTDIASGAYYYDAVLWAVENEITNGMGEGIFAPDATCTRGQIVTFLYRAMA